MAPKTFRELLFFGSEYEPAFEDRSRAFWPRFSGGQGSMFNDFWMIFWASWFTLGLFSPALSCLGFRCSWFGLQPTLPRKSKNLPKTKPRIQEPAEDKAEKKIRTDAYRKNQISKLRSSKLLSLSQTSLLQKRWAAVLPPGGLQLNNTWWKIIVHEPRYDLGGMVSPSGLTMMYYECVGFK